MVKGQQLTDIPNPWFRLFIEGTCVLDVPVPSYALVYYELDSGIAIENILSLLPFARHLRQSSLRRVVRGGGRR